MISYEKIDGYNNKKEGVRITVRSYQPYVCNKCHDFPMTVVDLSDYLNIKNNDYRVYNSNIDKKEAIIILKKI